MNLLIQKVYETFEANNSLLIDAGLQPVGTIDLYRGQPLNPEGFELYEIPALFLDYNIRWERQGRVYNGTGQLDVHVVTEAPWGTASNFTNREEALRRTFYYKIARKLLDDLESSNTSKLIRLDERPVDTGVITYHVLSYAFNYYDPEEIGGETIDVTDAGLLITGRQLVKKI